MLQKFVTDIRAGRNGHETKELFKLRDRPQNAPRDSIRHMNMNMNMNMNLDAPPTRGAPRPVAFTVLLLVLRF